MTAVLEPSLESRLVAAKRRQQSDRELLAQVWPSSLSDPPRLGSGELIESFSQITAERARILGPEHAAIDQLVSGLVGEAAYGELINATQRPRDFAGVIDRVADDSEWLQIAYKACSYMTFGGKPLTERWDKRRVEAVARRALDSVFENIAALIDVDVPAFRSIDESVAHQLRSHRTFAAMDTHDGKETLWQLMTPASIARTDAQLHALDGADGRLLDRWRDLLSEPNSFVRLDDEYIRGVADDVFAVAQGRDVNPLQEAYDSRNRGMTVA